MDQWRPFDIKSFLKASRHWDDDIKRLQEEHDSLALLPSTGDKPIGTGDISDMTASAALRRLKITSQIEEIMLYKEILACAFRTLPEDEIRLIKGFYYPNKPISVFVDEYCHEYGIGRTMLYQERDRIEQHMARLIESRYYE